MSVSLQCVLQRVFVSTVTATARVNEKQRCRRRAPIPCTTLLAAFYPNGRHGQSASFVLAGTDATAGATSATSSSWSAAYQPRDAGR